MWVDEQVQPFQRASAEQDHVSRLAEYHFVEGHCPTSVENRRTRPALERGAVGLPEA